MAFCKKCGAQLQEGKKFCADCGAPVEIPAPAAATYCRKCGAQLQDGKKFCAECGAPVNAQEPLAAPASAPAPKAAAKPAKKKKTGLILGIIAAILVLAVAAGVAAWQLGYLDFGGTEEEDEEVVEKKDKDEDEDEEKDSDEKEEKEEKDEEDADEKEGDKTTEKDSEETDAKPEPEEQETTSTAVERPLPDGDKKESSDGDLELTYETSTDDGITSKYGYDVNGKLRKVIYTWEDGSGGSTSYYNEYEQTLLEMYFNGDNKLYAAYIYYYDVDGDYIGYETVEYADGGVSFSYSSLTDSEVADLDAFEDKQWEILDVFQ